MRLVARTAGISLGSTYYYFASKEHLIQAFYARSHEEHLQACRVLLDRETDFEKRLLGVIRAKINSSMPYHRFARLLFKAAADPQSPLNPFSHESGPVRRQSEQLMAELVEGSDKLPGPPLRDRLPQLLWLYLMGIILFWIHDDSPGCDRTYRLIDRTVQIVSRLVSLSRLPFMRSLVRPTLQLLDDLGMDRLQDSPLPEEPTDTNTTQISSGS